jgi:peroxiredoxin
MKGKKMKKSIMIILAAAFALMSSAAAYAQDENGSRFFSSKPAIQVDPDGAFRQLIDNCMGKYVQDFSIETTYEDIDMADILQNYKAVLIECFSTNSEYSKDMMDILEGLYQKYQGEVFILGLSDDERDTLPALAAYAEERGLSYDLASDADLGLAAEMSMYYPTTMVIDRDGCLVFHQNGCEDNEEEILDDLLEYLVRDDYTTGIVRLDDENNLYVSFTSTSEVMDQDEDGYDESAEYYDYEENPEETGDEESDLALENTSDYESTNNDAEEAITLEYGEEVPDFSIRLTDGSTTSLYELMEDRKAALVVFWATFCGYCKAELPYVQRAFEQFPDDVAVVALTTYDKDSADDIYEVQQELGLGFPIGWDDHNLSEQVSDGIPAFFVVDRFGNLVVKDSGYREDPDMFVRLFEDLVSDDYTETVVMEDF